MLQTGPIQREEASLPVGKGAMEICLSFEVAVTEGLEAHTDDASSNENGHRH